MRAMIDAGLLTAEDPDMLALTFTAPITTLIHYCDREPEIMRQIEAFVKHFVKTYGKPDRNVRRRSGISR